MTLLPILLFVLGVLCLLWALRMGNSSGKSTPEMLTILQGLAGMKKEISQAQRTLREVEGQLGDHELRLIRNENVQADLRSEVNVHQITLNQLTSTGNPFTQSQSQPQPPSQPQLQPHVQYPPLDSYPEPVKHFQDSSSPLFPMNVQPSFAGSQRQVPEEPPVQPMPEKYQWVLELYHQGWSVAEIAGHLAISRDAVNMVLRTAPRGKGLEQ